jgi:hypothetical protein
LIVVVVGFVERWKIARLEESKPSGWVGKVGEHNLWANGGWVYQMRVWIRLWMKKRQ